MPIIAKLLRTRAYGMTLYKQLSLLCYGRHKFIEIWMYFFACTALLRRVMLKEKCIHLSKRISSSSSSDLNVYSNTVIDRIAHVCRVLVTSSLVLCWTLIDVQYVHSTATRHPCTFGLQIIYVHTELSRAPY